jgi:hypothetical protein
MTAPEMNLTDEQIIRFLVCEIHRLAESDVSNSAVRKSLFLLTRDLPKENRIRKAIPFYWFYRGPISDPLDLVHYSMEKEGKIQRVTTSEEANLYRCIVEPDLVVQKLFSDEVKDLSKIVRDYNVGAPNGLERLMEKCYERAPPFSKCYNIDFRRKYRGLYMALLFVEDQKTWRQLIDESIASLSECERALPTYDEFKTFNAYFSIFVRCYKQAFYSERMKNDADARRIFAAHTRELRDDIWKTFEEIFRTCDDGHDPGYEEKMREWILYANDTIILLGQYIAFYMNYVQRNFGQGPELRDTLDIMPVKSAEEHPSLTVIRMIAEGRQLPEQMAAAERHVESGCMVCKANLEIYRKLGKSRPISA